MVYRKRCDRCEKVSYSLSKEGAWICTGCGEDLARLPMMPVETCFASVLPFKAGAYLIQSRN